MTRSIARAAGVLARNNAMIDAIQRRQNQNDAGPALTMHPNRRQRRAQAATFTLLLALLSGAAHAADPRDATPVQAARARKGT